MKILLLLLLGFSVPAIAHNEFNGGCGNHCETNYTPFEESLKEFEVFEDRKTFQK
tara:strand:- start:192 stop:356 length:165 start_codon:yes stop_codon:yes gene_type:complete